MRPIQPCCTYIFEVVRSAPHLASASHPSKSLQTVGPAPALPVTGTTSRPPSRLYSRFPGAAYLCSADFSTGSALLQLLSASSSPTVATTPPDVAPQPVCATPCCFRPRLEDSASGPSIFRGHLCVHSRYGPATRRPPLTVVVSMGFRSSVSLLLAIQTTGLALTSAGLSPAERASLCWTHKSLMRFSWLPRPCAIRNTCSLLRFELLITIQYTYRRSPSSRYNCWSSLSTIGVRLIT